jgi:hypothetical protein
MKILPEEEVEERYSRMEKVRQYLLSFLPVKGWKVSIEVEKELGIIHIVFIMTEKEKNSTQSRIISERFVNDIMEIVCKDFHLKPLGKSFPVFLANTIRYDVMIE